MKKRILFGFIVLMGLFTITGCGSEPNYGTITDENGEKTKVTAKEMIDTHKGNEKKFESLYYKKTIEITDEVEKVMEQGSVTCLFLKNGWVIATDESEGAFIDFTSKLDVGDKVHISGSIYDVDGSCGGYDSEVEVDITSDSIMEVVK